jgi:hypothetical protein
VPVPSIGWDMDVTGGAARTGHAVLAAAVAVLIAALLNAPGGSGGTSNSRPGPETSPAPPPHLVVDPASWWMPAGNVTSLTAAWADPAPDCALSAYWFRWSVAGNSTGGTIAPAFGATVNFSATAVTTGTTTLLVRSLAVLACGPVRTPLVETAESNVTVDSAVELENLSMGPDPILPGQTSYLRGSVRGGTPPYDVRIAWGDGTYARVSVATEGNFSAPHTFYAGSYAPSVEVSDSDGLLAGGSVAESLSVAPTLAVGIEASRYITDVGVPVAFDGTVLDAPPGYDLGWSCGTPPELRAWTVSLSENFSCAFTAPGAGEVVFAASPPTPLASPNATLVETVAALPGLDADSANLTGEVGQQSLLPIDVRGGVPPFGVNWSVTGSGIGGVLGVPADGQVVLPIVPTEAGSLEVVARLVDADGLESANLTVWLRVDPSVSDSTVPSDTPTVSGEQVGLTGTLTGGVAPFEWVVVPASPPANDTLCAGNLTFAGWFAWSGTFRTEGWVSIAVVVVDAAGGFSNVSLTVPTLSPLSGNVSIPGSDPPPGAFSLEVSLAGGLPPFNVTVTSTDGESWSRNATSDGSTTWQFSALVAGNLSLQVTVTDASGADLEWNLSVPVVPAPISTAPQASGTSDSSAVGAGLLVVAALVLAVVYYARRRRLRAPRPPAPDPVAVLRRIVEPADGADRATVELLAEEAGVPLEVARSTIDRLIGEGTIRSDSGSDGEEAISWSTPEAPG